MSPLVGIWVANIEKSSRHANHQFQSATLTVAITGDVVSLHHAGVNMSGKEESGTTELLADGEAHPVSQAPGVTVVTKWAGPHSLETTAWKDGQSAGRGLYAVSADGSTLTATVGGTDAAGKAFEQVIVFDRTLPDASRQAGGIGVRSNALHPTAAASKKVSAAAGERER